MQPEQNTVKAVTAPESCVIDAGATIGYADGKIAAAAVSLGEHARIRSGTIIYADVAIGNHFQCGHHVMIRAKTTIGNHVTVGTQTVIEGQVEIGDFVKIESQCFIPTHVKIGSRVFLGPGVVLTNDRYPLRQRENYKPENMTIEDNVTVGARVVVCPGVTIGEGSFIAAGAVVTRDVPPRSFVKGVPGVISPLPEKLNENNTALSWKKYIGAYDKRSA